MKGLIIERVIGKVVVVGGGRKKAIPQKSMDCVYYRLGWDGGKNEKGGLWMILLLYCTANSKQ